VSLDKIQAFQEATKACQRVFAVEVSCDGEHSITSLWDTKAAAELCRDQHNNMKGNGAGYYGRARVLSMPVKTEKMARDLYSAEGERNDA
jgi:hypothetical protein